MKKFTRWFVIGLFLTVILTSGVVYRWTGNQIFSQPKIDATLPAITKSNTSKNSSDFSEPPLRKWGYMNYNGQLVIPPRFDYARPFSSGVARVEIDEGEKAKIGFIDRKGEFVFSICGEDCLVDGRQHIDFSEGLLPLREEPKGKFGFVDTTGEFVIKPQFDSVRSFAEGLAAVSWRDANDKSHHGYIDRTGKIVIDMGNLSVGNFQQGVAIVVEPFRFRYGMIDREGNLLVKPILSAIIYDEGDSPKIEFNCERMPVKVVESKVDTLYSTPLEWRGKWGYIDRKGNWAIEPQFDAAGKCTQGRAVVANETENDPEWWKWGMLIDERGNIIDTSQQNPKAMLMQWETVFHERLAAVSIENGKSGYIDRSGNWAIEPQFAAAEKFSDGLAAVETLDFKWGYINRSGGFVIPPQFDFAYDFQDSDLAIVKVREKEGIINRRGEYVLEPKYSVYLSAGIGTIFIDGVVRIRLNDAKESPSYYLNSDLEILTCPQWGSGDSSEGLIPIFTDVAPQEECPIARNDE